MTRTTPYTVEDWQQEIAANQFMPSEEFSLIRMLADETSANPRQVPDPRLIERGLIERRAESIAGYAITTKGYVALLHTIQNILAISRLSDMTEEQPS